MDERNSSTAVVGGSVGDAGAAGLVWGGVVGSAGEGEVGAQVPVGATDPDGAGEGDPSGGGDDGEPHAPSTSPTDAVATRRVWRVRTPRLSSSGRTPKARVAPSPRE